MKTDRQLKDDITSELRWEPSVNAEQIGVEVKDGVVTLAGQTDSYAEKWNAEQAAQRVSGVRALAVTMDVKLAGPHRRSDSEIAASAAGALQWKTYWANDTVKVVVENGWLILAGEVEWEYQRQEAANALRYLTGVKGISNNIVIKTKVTVGSVKSDIEAAMKRRAIADAATIRVEVHGADVTLSGTVKSWPERELARYSAWSTAGVQNVVNNIVVSY
ncbi:BON domain-containing protein [Pseudomonas sp. RIT-To-2]|uniref:BON domain-containing protein n=1 Tax=Pseudomonas sp. RIT-To-2 TaxID=3462541 RepID=UPI002413C057